MEIQDEIGEYICLAMRAGLAAREEVGEDIGAVVVDRSGGNGPSVIAVAGDARWNGITGPDEGGNGNAMAHAVMRVIGMVARQRLALLKVPGTLSPGPEGPNLFADKPLTSLEHQIYSASTLAPGGYLCHDLELYLTHEPCVMCSMAIVHSRFGRVIFGQRMPLTGGLAAEMEESDTANAGVHGQGEAYGLWWRPELNWKVLGWQWIDDEVSNEELGEQVHA